MFRFPARGRAPGGAAWALVVFATGGPVALGAQTRVPPEQQAAGLYLLAREARARGEPEQAARWLEEATRLDEDAVLPRLEWAETLLVIGLDGRVPEALDPITTRVEARADSAPAEAAAYHRLRAAVRLRAGDHAGAARLYARAAEYAPGDVGLRSQLLGLHRLLGEREREIEDLHALAALVPGSADVRVRLGEALGELGRWSESETAFLEAVALGGSPEAWDGLGTALAGQGRHADAETAYRAGLRLAPASAALHEHLGDALQAAGRPAEALVAYERAAALAGSEEGLEGKIERARTAAAE